MTLSLAIVAAVAAQLAPTSFEQAAESAERIDRDGLTSVLWSALVDCEARADDLLRRQCRGVRAARARAVAGQTYVMRLGAGALWSGEPDPARGGAAFGLRGCLACGAPIDVGAGEPRFVVTRGSVLVTARGLVGPDLFHGVRPEAPRLVGELVFRLPATAATWSEGGKSGLFVEPVAWRLWDACDGTILAAQPASRERAAALDATECGEAPAGPSIVADERPDQLSAAQIRQVMREVGEDVNRCFDSYGVPGTADLWFDVAGDGHVRHAEVRGDLADTPTARCVVAAVKKAPFPPFRRASMQIHYPFILR